MNSQTNHNQLPLPPNPELDRLLYLKRNQLITPIELKRLDDLLDERGQLIEQHRASNKKDVA